MIAKDISKRIKALIVVLTILVTAGTAAVIFAVNYSNAKIVFTGMEMKMGADGNIQGMVNVSLQHVNAQAVHFTLAYDKRYLEPSNYITNEIIEQGEDETRPAVLKIFKTNSILEGAIRDLESVSGYTETLKEDANFGSVSYTINTSGSQEVTDENGIVYVKKFTQPYGPSAGGKLDFYQIMADDPYFENGISLGDISFQIKDPAAISGKSINDILYITKVTAGDTSVYNVMVMYYDEDDEIDHEEHISVTTPEMLKKYVQFAWDVKTEVTAVSVAEDSITALAPQVYYNSEKTASKADLIEYLNRNYNKISVLRSDLSQTIEDIKWGNTEYGFKLTDANTGREVTDEDYDPKATGGKTYKVVQNYNSETDKKAEMTITVEPVTLTGFSTDPDRLIKTYKTIQEVPETDLGLELPEYAYGTLDRAYDMADVTAAIPAVSVRGNGWTYTPEHDEGVTAIEYIWNQVTYEDDDEEKPITPTVTINYTSAIPTDGLQAAYPWLTIPDSGAYSITAVRNVNGANQTGAPRIGTVTTEDGKITIKVTGLGDTDENVNEDTIFTLYLPDGTALKTGTAGLSAGIDEGQATVTLDTSANGFDETLKKLITEYINTGTEGFKLSATEKDNEGNYKFESAATDVPVERINYYTSDVMLDFRDTNKSHKSSILPLAVGTKLCDISKYIDFSIKDFDQKSIETTFNGSTGKSPGKLKQAKVKSWILYSDKDGELDEDTAKESVSEDSAEEEPTLPEGDFWLRGELATYTYSDYGTVTEHTAPHYITIAVTAADEKSEEEKALATSITVTASNKTYGHDAEAGEEATYLFGKKTLHYSAEETPSKTFTIKNTGTAGIEGLNVHVDSNDFVITAQPASALPAEDDTTEFTLRAKHDLPVGKYTANVYIYSNTSDGGTELKSFGLELEVVTDATFTVTVVADPPEWGTIVIKEGGESYSSGETVKVEVEAAADYEFDRIGLSSYATLGYDEETGYYTFDIESNTVVTAYFKETAASKLHLQELHIYDDDGNEIEEKLEYNDNGVWKETQFMPGIFDYRVTVKSTVNVVSVDFKPRYSYITNDGDIVTTANVERESGTGGLVPQWSDKTEKFTLYLPPETGQTAPTIQYIPINPKKDYNTITITRAIKDETNTDVAEENRKRTVTVTIYRQPVPDVNLTYGNSPFGIIARQFPSDSEADKSNREKYQQAFVASSPKYKFTGKYKSWLDNPNTLTDPDILDTDSLRRYKDAYYSPDAWDSSEKNLDLSETAIFVYVGSGMSFTDPGWKSQIYDSAEGDNGEKDTVKTLQAKIKLKTYNTSKPFSYSSGTGTTDDIVDYYTSAVDTIRIFPIDLTDDKTGNYPYFGMDDLNIRPGAYKIEYSYEDSVNGTMTFERDLVVLPKPGNMLSRTDTPALNDTDTEIAYRYNESGLAPELLMNPEGWERLLAYRVMDVNGDRNVNAIDAHNIQNKAKANEAVDGIYIPLMELTE